MIAWFEREYASLFKEKRPQEKDLLSGKKRCWSRGASRRSPFREGFETGKQEVEFHGIFSFFFCIFAGSYTNGHGKHARSASPSLFPSFVFPPLFPLFYYNSRYAYYYHIY